MNRKDLQKIVDDLVEAAYSKEEPEYLFDKCIVKGCQNHRTQGKFIKDLCWPCYDMLSTGEVMHGDTWIHQLVQQKSEFYCAGMDLYNELEALRLTAKDAGPAMEEWLGIANKVND